jgi:hypothetical protein
LTLFSLVELHDLLLLALLVLLVLLLNLLHLRGETLHPHHRLDLTEGQRDQHRAHGDRQQHDRPAPRDPAAVEELQDRLEDVDQRLEDVGGDEHGQALGVGSRDLNRR